MTTALHGPVFRADPHAVYRAMREEAPVHRVELAGGVEAWLVTRYDDAKAALTDPRLVKGVLHPPRRMDLPDDVHSSITHHMLSADPPDHTRLRRLVSATFTPRRIEALRPRITALTAELLDAMDGLGAADLIETFAFPLPIAVISELLGVPMEDREAFRSWSNLVTSPGDRRAEAPRAVIALHGYVQELITQKRKAPGDDLLSAMIAVREGGDRLTEEELSSTVFLLLIAGHETTVNLIANGVYRLLSERDRWEELRARRELLPSAIEEFLRFDSPVQTSTVRISAQPLTIGGVDIPAGRVVMVSLLSANMDGARYPDPEQLRLSRTGTPHLAFGHGIHYCLGAPLARLEAQIAFTGLLDRFPNLRMTVSPAELTWRPGTLIHGLEALPVTGLTSRHT
ncbi:cytochrome P450 family protein [Catenuloplanes atrovinosus]|uniref:Cytochrome P450 n=1 Tax=Catenuloplanes atrovinosus TaxID=137266 RepID=A0AAE4CC63_9ACTN|nr:cytochrome P450 [Catenuloplanes atrovinosus]MDR7278877.1 cytochrome P450 [Catenuloplanes atrovinosus]